MPDIPAPLLTALISLLGSFIGAWLAARFALSRFYSEKVWERKTAAYTAIFDALHDMNRWYEEHILEFTHDTTVTPERAEQLGKESRAAEAALRHRLLSETWLIPDNIAGRIDLAFAELEVAKRNTGWHDYLYGRGRTMSTLIADLQRMTRQDLRLQGPLSPLWRNLRFHLFMPKFERRYRKYLRPPH
jgi:hypothetical protein